VLRKHVQRANYQAGGWLRALEAKPSIPSPVGYGWHVVDGQLTAEWMTQKPALDELLLPINCHCQKGCTSGRCSCVRAGMPCTDACASADCNNHWTACPGDTDTDTDVTDEDL
jgi:hypothetical protein